MATTTENTYVGNGSTVLYSFTFPYLEVTDVYVSVNGTDLTPTTEYIYSNATTIQFNTAPASGAAIRIYRETSSEDLKAVFFPGSAIRSSDLNDNFSQSLYTVQESTNSASSATSTANTAKATADTALANANSAVTTANSTIAAANTAVADASAAVTTANAANTTANTASTNASNAVTTANAASTAASTADTNATTALNTANTAISTANGAVTTANSASTTANTASTNASAAVTTANSASTDASAAVSTANTASTNASTALSTANAASAAVSQAVLFTLVANVAAIPSSPSNNDYIEVVDSTGIQSFTPLSGLPSSFVGASGLTARLRYDSATTSWVWMSYFANDSEDRYLTKSLPVVVGDATNGSGQITLNCENNSHGVKIKGPPHSAGASYTLTLPNDTGTANQVLTTNGSGLLNWSNGGSPTIDAGNFNTGGSLVSTSQTFDGGSFD